MALLAALISALVLAGVLALATAGPTSAQPVTCGNGLLDSGEECDLSSPLGAFCPPGEVCSSSCDCVFLPTTTQPTTTVTPTTSSTSTTTLLNHFQCYEVRKSTSPPHSGVSVQDQFRTVTGLTLTRPHKFCAPTDKEDEDPTAPNDPDHLKAYQDKHSATKVLNQTIVNQFGTLQLDITNASFLLVPASKNLLAAPPPLTPPTVDHFQCYKVKRSRGAPKFAKVFSVAGQDQFGPYSLDLLRPRWFCAPASKNGEDPTAPTHPEHLLCYKARNHSAFAERTAFANDQFGVENLLLTRRIELCVPSLKNPGTTTTSTAPVTTTTSSTAPPTTTSSSTAPPTTTSSSTTPPTTVTTTTNGQSTTTTTSSTTTSSTTTTTLYGSPSRAFLEPIRSLLD